MKSNRITSAGHSSNTLLNEVLAGEEITPHLKAIISFTGKDYHAIVISQLSKSEYELKFKTIDDCTTSELAMKTNGRWLDCYSYRILVRGYAISCFMARFISENELPQPTYDAIENISDETGVLATDFINAIKDTGSIYAETMRNSLIERFGNNIAYLDESIISTDMRIVKYIMDNELSEAKHFI